MFYKYEKQSDQVNTHILSILMGIQKYFSSWMQLIYDISIVTLNKH